MHETRRVSLNLRCGNGHTTGPAQRLGAGDDVVGGFSETEVGMDGCGRNVWGAQAAGHLIGPQRQQIAAIAAPHKQGATPQPLALLPWRCDRPATASRKATLRAAHPAAISAQDGGSLRRCVSAASRESVALRKTSRGEEAEISHDGDGSAKMTSGRACRKQGSGAPHKPRTRTRGTAYKTACIAMFCGASTSSAPDRHPEAVFPCAGQSPSATSAPSPRLRVGLPTCPPSWLPGRRQPISASSPTKDARSDNSRQPLEDKEARITIAASRALLAPCLGSASPTA